MLFNFSKLVNILCVVLINFWVKKYNNLKSNVPTPIFTLFVKICVCWIVEFDPLSSWYIRGHFDTVILKIFVVESGTLIEKQINLHDPLFLITIMLIRGLLLGRWWCGFVTSSCHNWYQTQQACVILKSLCLSTVWIYVIFVYVRAFLQNVTMPCFLCHIRLEYTTHFVSIYEFAWWLCIFVWHFQHCTNGTNNILGVMHNKLVYFCVICLNPAVIFY